MKQVLFKQFLQQQEINSLNQKNSDSNSAETSIRIIFSTAEIMKLSAKKVLITAFIKAICLFMLAWIFCFHTMSKLINSPQIIYRLTGQTENMQIQASAVHYSFMLRPTCPTKRGFRNNFKEYFNLIQDLEQIASTGLRTPNSEDTPCHLHE